MSTKVLVFESDAAFAGELRNELGKLGCSTCVVDDGSVGLQQASAEKPDLILLSIELPRMNGFSVCNKLKKDAALKDVPLIIMSSESSEETFEQHRKLRTRAEDYVHKPIAFGELLGHIQSFVQVGSPPEPGADADGIVIDDEISLQHVEDIDDDDDGAETEIAMRPDFDEPKKTVDPEMDSFADEAFGRLQNVPPEAAAREFNGGGSAISPSTGNIGGGPPKLPGARPIPSDPRGPKVGAVPGRPAATNEAELERLRAELDRYQSELQRTESKAAGLQAELAEAREQVNRVHQEADAEVDRMQRDLHELKSRASLLPKAGAVSSREFLDLREGLNKKDKEILALKTQLTVKDKEIFEARDRSLGLERQTSELDDRLLAKDREVAETGDRVDELTEKLAARESELADLKRLVGEAESDAASSKTELADIQSKRAEERGSYEATVATLKGEHAESLAQSEAARVKALDESRAQHQAELEELTTRHRAELEAREARRISELEQARREREADADEAQRRALTAQSDALALREGELQREMDSKLAALQRAQEDELTRTRSEAQQQLDGSRREAAEALASREQELERRRVEEVSTISARAAAELAEATGQVADLERDLETSKRQNRDLAQEKLAGDAENEARIANLEGKLSDTTAAKQSLEAEFAVARDRIGALEVDLSSARGELQSTQKRLETQTARADRAFAKWDADRVSLERAKDALAVALAQLDETEARPIQDP
jgi:CheY-like chemotaxis protein